MVAKIISQFFSSYISFIIRKDFHLFHFNKPKLENDKAILLLANHFSWWDGFLLFHINKLFLKKKFHVMVSEENYKKVFFLKYLGAFPVKKQSKQLVESLKDAGELLNNSENLVLIFPQGQLHSNHEEEISFERGLMYIINSSQQEFQYLFSASFVDYFQNRKPSVYCYLETWENTEQISLSIIKNAYNKHYQASRQQHNRIKV